MKSFEQLFTEAAKKPKPAKVTITNKYHNGLSDFPGVVFSINNQNYAAKIYGRKHYNNLEFVYVPEGIMFNLGSTHVDLDKLGDKFKTVLIYRDAGSTNRNAHSYPVLVKDAKKLKQNDVPVESEAAWKALEKVVLAELKEYFKTEEGVRNFNFTNTVNNHIAVPTTKSVKDVATKDVSTNVSVDTTQKTTNKNSHEKLMAKLLKSANAKFRVSSSDSFSRATYDSTKDFIKTNHMKNELDDLGATYDRRSNSTKAIYNIDDTQVEFGYNYVTVRNKR